LSALCETRFFEKHFFFPDRVPKKAKLRIAPEIESKYEAKRTSRSELLEDEDDEDDDELRIAGLREKKQLDNQKSLPALEFTPIPLLGRSTSQIFLSSKGVDLFFGKMMMMMMTTTAK
jgi:hypothetical protein